MDRFTEAGLVIETGVETKGASDHIEFVGGRGFGAFEDVLEDARSFAAAAMDEAGGVCVTIDGIAVGDAVIMSDMDGTAPANEFAFDGVPIRVGADQTTTRVASEVGRRSRRWGPLDGSSEGSEGGVRVVEREANQLCGLIEFLS